ncbi:MAG TPA: VWA domain-containing protein [Vicinamibacteria bacterium]|nr:VWA domain-containing protein [Vicinamibacteria bacterium]
MRCPHASALVVAFFVTSGAAPAQPPPATFPSKVELITVDAVVLDAQGHPVSGLKREDFILEEDGRPQEISSFEAFVAAPPPATKATAPPALASNEGERPRGSRAFALVLDDAGMLPRDAIEARRAVETFLVRSVRDGDEVSLATTSGDAWWSARLPEGREDLSAVIARLRGRGAEPSLSFDSMSDYEGFWIHNRESGTNGPMVRRVVNRWLEAGVCINPVGGSSQQERGTRLLESCPNMVRARAGAVDEQRRAHTRLILGTCKRSLQALAPVRGRKSLLLFSRGFLQDSEPDPREVVAASREANTAVYFVNVRGLATQTGMPSVADATSAPDPGLLGVMGFEDSTLESAGTRALADDTGGFSIVNTNDLAGGAERIAEESRVFYLLGFQAPPGKPPGQWRTLRVDVKGTVPGLKVRARRAYTLGQPAHDAPAKTDTAKAARHLSPAVERALDTVHETAGIPLRAMVYVFEPRPKDTARVLVAAEFDASRLTFQGTGKARTARLEVTIAATPRDTGKTLYANERVEVRVPEGEAAAWRSFAREFDLPAGVAQARMVVRDPASDLLGAVSQRFEVPHAGTLRLATPVITDQVVRPPGGEGRPRAALAVHRVFLPTATLYCEIEVFGAPRHADGSPHVSAGLAVRNASGETVRQAAPTRIAADRDGRVVRLLGLGLAGLAEGDYQLVLDVHDEVGLGRIERQEPFTIAR